MESAWKQADAFPIIAHTIEAMSLPHLAADERTLRLELPSGWLDRHPLTRTDLEQKRNYFKALDIKLQVRASERKPDRG